MMSKELKNRILSSIILIPVAIFFIIQGSVSFIFFLSLIFLITSFEWLKMTNKKDLVKIFGLLFLFFSFYSVIYIRQYIGLNFSFFINYLYIYRYWWLFIWKNI